MTFARARRSLLLLLPLLWPASRSDATPSGTFWAPSTPAVQAYGVPHVTYDTYFGAGSAYPVDAGLTIGVLPGSAIQAEVGFDLFYPTYDDGEGEPFPVVLNAKLGGPENGAFAGQPAWSVGIYAAGFLADVNNYNILHLMLGRTIPRFGLVQIGGYYGLNPDLLRSADGGEQRAGLMAGWLSPPLALHPFDKVVLAWDLQSGRNAAGATGGGAYFYLTPAVALGMGPVWFFEPELQPGGSSWMWTLQLDVDLQF